MNHFYRSRNSMYPDIVKVMENEEDIHRMRKAWIRQTLRIDDELPFDMEPLFTNEQVEKSRLLRQAVHGFSGINPLEDNFRGRRLKLSWHRFLRMNGIPLHEPHLLNPIRYISHFLDGDSSFNGCYLSRIPLYRF